MKKSPGSSDHPGAYVRQMIIPPDKSVKEAAEHLGVDMSTLSNFLNEQSSFSSEMATRLERSFGVEQKKLLEMQTTYDQKIRESSVRTTVHTFVPNFLTIKARQIEDWAHSQIDARHHFPVLLRKLIHSTGNGLRQVDFPGYDNAQRKGSDGFVEAGVATPWVPVGDSYWEFGTDQNPGGKAESDYTARLKSVDSSARLKSTFVFVTPRNWHAKKAWENRKNDDGEWKDVRVLDASDLEQWLEQSVPAQIWLAEQLALPVNGYETLEHTWKRWANASAPRLAPEIFTPSITANRETFKTWLNMPNDRPLVIGADSRDEALAFLACLFDDPEFCHFMDQTAVFTSPEALRTIIASSVTVIPIVYTEDAERELVNAHNPLHYIVYRPNNASDAEVDIKLDLLSHETFKNALTSMGIEERDIERLARESGRSPTILRRRLSHNLAIRMPEWARDDNKAKALVPMTMIGAWHAETEADRRIVANTADRDYETIENDIVSFLMFDDSPLWSAGHFRGVVSKIDSFFAVARMVTPADLNRFFVAAEYVLSEFNPALDLPEKDRWAAALYKKTRNHSNALRNGICETLVILAVHGNNLFQSRLGIDIERRVVMLVRKLLTPLSLEKLLSHDRDLPCYAEAAPDEFLKIIEEDLRSEEPVVLGLLKPVDSGLVGVSPSRTGLLWALECLAWKPKSLPRVSLILARLSQLKIEDNWVNKPDASLQSIFRSWMPQTSASIEQRIRVLELLIKRYPDIGWEICIEQIHSGSRLGHYSYRPNWRSDASGAGQVVTRKEMYDFNRKSLDLLISWPSHNEKTLGDLAESLEALPEEDKTKIWDLIDRWSQNARESAKAMLRERIRQFAFSRRSRLRKLAEVTRDRAREAYESLQPKNPVIRHGWLFAEQWVQESVEETEKEEFDYRKWEEQIDRLRRDAIKEIWDQLGFQGIQELLVCSGAAGEIGRYSSFCITSVKAQVDFIQSCLSSDEDSRSKMEWCLQGFLTMIKDDLRDEVLQKAAQGLTSAELNRLFVCSPFQASTWRLLDKHFVDIRTGYWKNVTPTWGRHTPAELTELIDCLLAVKRPRAAFHAVHMNFKDIETSLLKELLRNVATVDAEPAVHYRIAGHYISRSLDSLDGRADITTEELAQLEFLFIDALSDSEHGIPNLERHIAESPELFVQAVTLADNRRNVSKDSQNLGIQNPDQQVAIMVAAHHLLGQISIIPGTDKNGKIDVVALSLWLSEVRRLCRECGSTEIGDYRIGQLLSRAPMMENGIWPSEEICEAMEEIASPDIGRGFSVGVFNSRGAHWRGEGGEQERQLAAKYRTFAERLHFDYPYVGGILDEMAQSYEHEAELQDSKANISKRLID